MTKGKGETAKEKGEAAEEQGRTSEGGESIREKKKDMLNLVLSRLRFLHVHVCQLQSGRDVVETVFDAYAEGRRGQTCRA